MHGCLLERRIAVAAGLVGVIATSISTGANAAAASGAAPSAATIAQVTNAITGQSDASSLAPERVCPIAGPGRATCYAQVLAVRSDREYVHPKLSVAASPDRFVVRLRHGRETPTSEPAAASAPQAGTPAYLDQAYDLTYLSQNGGAGDTVAVVDAYDDPSAESDLGTYRAEFGLPACTTANGCFEKVNQTGDQGSYPRPLPPVTIGTWRSRSISIRCRRSARSVTSSSSRQMTTTRVTSIRHRWRPRPSGPIRSPTAGVRRGARRRRARSLFPGVETVAAAGDSGYLGPGENQYPAALADVTAAGGTTLTPASGGSPRGYTESAWSGAGSGCDLTQSKPAWQSDTGCTGRSYDDLSADADPNTGMVIYDSGGGGWLVVGGTSEATPLIAAYYAITGASAQTPAWAYGVSSELNDPQTGSNGSCPSNMLYICDAGVGYDGPTGEGSISGAVTAGGPGIGGPGSAGSYATSATASTAQLQAGIYPNSSNTTWWVEHGTTTAYGQQTAPVDVGGGSSPVAVSATLTGLSDGLSYHYRLVAQNGYGTTYGYDYTLSTAPPSAPTVSSAGASANGQTATLTGVVDPEGGATTHWFNYGTTRALNRHTASQTVSGSTNTDVSAVLSGLAAHTTYYYQLVASNAGGNAASAIQSFQTNVVASASSYSKVTIGKVVLKGARAAVGVSCRGSVACRVRVRLTIRGRLLASRSVTVGAHRTVTIHLTISRGNAEFARKHPRGARIVLLELQHGGYRAVEQKTVNERR